jgi:hypothetical protein
VFPETGFLDETQTEKRGTITMRIRNRNRRRMIFPAVRVNLTEAEIMADLRYPAAGVRGRGATRRDTGADRR